MQPWEEPARQLPVTFPPVGGETVGSYLNRLALGNRMRAGALARYVAPYRRSPSAVDDDTSVWTPATPPRLAVISGQSLHSLTRALPALTQPAVPPRPHHLLAGCRRCMASQGVTCLVVVRDQPHRHLCARHGLWLRATTQVDGSASPTRATSGYPTHWPDGSAAASSATVGGNHPTRSSWRACPKASSSQCAESAPVAPVISSLS